MSSAGARPYDAGLWAAIRCRWARLWLRALRMFFGFDAWHAAAPYCCRAYKRTVVELANALHPERVVEVGCGLGDIVSRITAAQRVGIDCDGRVIRAARFLHPGGRWIQGDTAALSRLFPPEHRIDCLIMVNWIHALSPQELGAALMPVLPHVRYLILDAIDADDPQTYRHRHDFRFLDSAARRISATRVQGEARTFVVLESLR